MPPSSSLTSSRDAGGLAENAKDVESSVLGMWRLLYIETTDQHGDVVVDANIFRGRGANPSGILVYSSAGTMSVQIAPSDRARYEGDQLSGEQAKAIVRGFTAYFGTYTLDVQKGCVIHHVESHVNPNLIGVDYTRFYEFANNQLVLRLPPVVVRGREQTQRLYWTRIGRAGEP
jgi:hypothetical protein